jgi:hypothetical protein
MLSYPLANLLELFRNIEVHIDHDTILPQHSFSLVPWDTIHMLLEEIKPATKKVPYQCAFGSILFLKVSQRSLIEVFFT